MAEKTINFENYIAKEVIVKRDEDFTYDDLEGILIDIIPAAEAEDCVDTLVIDTGAKHELVPVNKLRQFLPVEELNQSDTEYYYVVLRYGKTERSKEHIYMSYDSSVKPGDKVLTWQDWLYVGNVIRTGYYTRKNAPFPVEKTWLIQQKVYDRIDFMQYEDSRVVIEENNLYQNRYLNAENDYRQFVAKVDYPYQLLADEYTDFFESRKPTTSDSEKLAAYAVGEAEYELDWEWCESNQLDVFYRALCLCTYIAKNNGYHPFSFDKYLCLSLIYKHGDFDEFMLTLDKDKKSIERDVCFLDAYIRRRKQCGTSGAE